MILTHLTDRLADSEPPVRVDAALALAQFGRPEGVLPLRLKAAVGDEEPEVTGQCFASLLALAPDESIRFVGQFLNAKKEDVRGEAAAALAQARRSGGVPDSHGVLQKEAAAGSPPQRTHGSGRVPAARSCGFAFVGDEKGSGDFAATALKALAASRFRHEMRDRARKIAEENDDEDLLKIFDSVYELG